MVKYNVFQVVHPKDVPSSKKLINFAWEMKKKPNGTYRARLALRGFKQKEHTDYRPNDKSAPVVSETTIKIGLALVILWNLYASLTDCSAAFLHGYYQRPKEQIYTEVPRGFEKWYPPWCVLLCLKTIYGGIQSGLQWWREICKVIYYLKWKRHEVDPCLFVKWKNNRLILFLVWVDDALMIGNKADVLEETKRFRSLFNSTDEAPGGNLIE